MRQPLYIQAATAITAQHTFHREAFLNPIVQSGNGRLYVVDTDYSKYISPVAIRRMSRALKMAISAAMQCLSEAGVDCPDAIITGTGRGSIADMQTFLKDMIRLEEEALNPTFFIQSTYNSPNGWIAMQSKCNSYNQTYVQRGSSLELALMDAQLLIAEKGEDRNVLAGSYDEMTEDYFVIKRKIEYWKHPTPASSLDVLKYNDTVGSVGGEGTTFFLVSGEKREAATAIRHFKIIQQYIDAAAVSRAIDEVLAHEGITKADVDVLLTGQSGDVRFQPLYAFVDSFKEQGAAIAAFKHLSGEYDTATGFGIWLADHLIRTQELPEEVIISGSTSGINYVLLVNHYIHGSATVMLLQKA